jgi:HEAT repeats
VKTYEQVRQILSAIEPDEEMYHQISAEDLQHLQRMLHDPEPWRAARAIHAASRMGSVGAQAMVSGAVADTRREVRAAVAMAAQWLAPEASNALLEKLLDDEDLSIKKLAIKSVSRTASPALLRTLKTLSESSGNEHIKSLASERLRINR